MTTIKHTLTTHGLAILLGAAAIALLAAIPATSHAGPRFGADLQGVTPETTPVKCTNPGAPCTRALINYWHPSHAGKVPFAPRKGKVRRIRLKAGAPGVFRLQLVRMKGFAFPNVRAKVVRKGPRIRYEGTGSVEAFKVKVPVRRGMWLAMRTRKTAAVQCETDAQNEAIFAPPIKLGDSFRSANDVGDCTHLVQAVMK